MDGLEVKTPELLTPAVGRNPAEADAVPIKIVDSGLMLGCNVHHRQSVAWMEVDLGNFANRLTRDLAWDFVDRFRMRFIAPSQHVQGTAVAADFVARLNSSDGAPIEEALLQAILAVETEVLAAMQYLDRIDFSTVCSGRSGSQVLLVWESHSNEMSLRSARVAVQGFAELLPGRPLSPTGEGFDVAIAALKVRALRRKLSGSTSLLKLAARRRGVPHEVMSGKHLRLGTVHDSSTSSLRCLAPPRSVRTSWRSTNASPTDA